MDFTSNLRISNQALSVSNFPNRNSFFRVNIPSNEIFQSELSEMSAASITYSNEFKVLPSYLNSNIINRFYMYSGDLFSVNSMQLNDSKRGPSSINDISSDVSHDPHVFIKS